MPRSNRRTALVATLALMLGVLTAAPAAAEGPHGEAVPSFGESPGCGALDGVGGPRMGTTGSLPDSTPVLGPWGDFFGRTIGDVRSQLVKVHLPGQPKDLWIHKRALPAFELMLDNLAAEASAGNTYPITSYTWSFNPATIPPTTKLSFHGVGASIDVNSHTNPYRADNVLITDMPGWFVDAWTEAGWCWGGDWQTIKDPMHFSWMGPIHTPGYDMSSAPPQPPKVAFSDYSNHPSFPEFSYDVTFDSGAAGGALHFAVDLDANGAADVVRLRETTGGRIALEASRARHEFTRSTDWAVTTTAPTDASAPVALFDVTGDARADLVYFLQQPDDTISFEVFPLVQGGNLTPLTIPTSVPASPDAVYLFDDFDMDGESDLYVVRPGSPGTIEVWMGPYFASPEVSVSVAQLPADTKYATGDRDLDGTADLYALAADGALRIFIGADPAFESVGSISAAQMGLDPSDERFFVDDLDGDGHPDLLLVDGSGQLRMRRGGFSSHDPGVWFVVDSEIVSEPPPAPVRVAGADRYKTAVAASKQSHPGGADVVYVAVGTNYPDAIAGGSAAAAEDAPILLVLRTKLPNATRTELQRLDPDLVVVLGGTGAVSDGIVAEIGSAVPGATVVRRAGSNRYTTAVAVTKAAFAPGVDTLYVASGETFTDALIAAPWAVAGGNPLLLTRPDRLLGSVRSEIQRLDPSQIVIIGNTNSVSILVAQDLAAMAPVQRVTANDPYSLSAAVSVASYPHGASIIYVAVGDLYPDALAAGPLTGTAPGPLLLVRTTSIPNAVLQEISRIGPHEVVVMGGAGAVSDSVVAQIATHQD